MKKKLVQALLVSAMIPSMYSLSVAPIEGQENIIHNNQIQTPDQGLEQINQIKHIIDKVEKNRRKKIIIKHSNVIDIKKTPPIEEYKIIKKERLKREKLERIKKQKEKKKREEKIRKKKVNEYQTKIQNIDAPNRKEWFIQYKQLQDEYSKWIQRDTTLYDVYDANQLELLFRIVETEVRGDCYFDEKANVASVIFNRLRIDTNNWFPDTLVGILTEYPQFESYLSGAYQYVTVTETTKLACEYAYQIGDTTGGALWFDSTDGNSWADNHRHMLFKDYVGHAFYN